MAKICNIALVGRPNAGKSTLFNYFLHQKLGIVSPKANTTRFSLSGAREEDNLQFQVTDTPGWDTLPKGPVGKMLATSVRSSLMSAEAIVVVMDGVRRMTDDDKVIYDDARDSGKPCEVVFTKCDLIDSGSEETFQRRVQEVRGWGYEGIVWRVSGKSGHNVAALKAHLLKFATDGERVSGPSIDKKRYAEECVREHAFRCLNQEVPYGLWVELVEMQEEADMCTLKMDIKVLLDRHKPIVLGAGGQMIKRIGSRARQALMYAWGQHVRLFLTVKVGKEEDLVKSCMQ